MIAKTLLIFGVSATTLAQQDIPEEPDWFSDLESIETKDLDSPSPWYGTIASDVFVAQNPNAMDSRFPRRQLSLLYGWQGGINSEVSGNFNTLIKSDSEEYTQPHGNREQSYSLEANEFYLDWKLAPALSLKAGRQKLGIGNAQSIRVLDLVSPMDSKVPGYGNLEQLKLPVSALSLSYNQNLLTHRLLFIPEQRKDTTYTTGAFAQPAGDNTHKTFELDRGVYSLGYQGSLIDWQIIGGRIFNPQQQLGSGGPFFQSENMAGLLFGLTKGSARLFTELSTFQVDQTWPTAPETFDGNSALVGFTYTGFPKTQIHLEAYRKSLDSSDMDEEKRVFFQAQYQTLRDTLTLSLEVTAITSADAVVTNLGTDYNWRDGWQFRTGVLVFQADEDSSFRALHNHDTLFFSASYHW